MTASMNRRCTASRGLASFSGYSRALLVLPVRKVATANRLPAVEVLCGMREGS